MTDPFAELNAALVDRYVVDRELGRGGMALVYLARDVKHERFVALKTLRPEIAIALGRERFLREIKLAARLQHPNILPVYDSGDAGGTLYYVMPYVEGESLRDRLEREPQLPVDDALQIAREVADALSYAHDHDVVHRDIKPENIMLSGGHAIVTDFGIARAVSAAGGDKLTQTGLAIGTPAYMPPEQASGSGQVDRRSDIYSLACVLYETLAGQPPFTGPTAQAIMARHSLDAVPRLKIVRDAIPDDLEVVIERALEKVPADRYQTSGEFAKALTVASTGRVSRITQARRPRRRWQVPLIVAASVVAVGLGGWLIFGAGARHGVGGGAPSGGGLDARRVAVLYFTDLSRDSSLGHVAAGLTEGLITELQKVRALAVVSVNGVAPFRGQEDVVPRDSIARALHASTLVAGSVEPVGDRVRATVRLVDGTSGADVGERVSFTLPANALLQVRDSVIRETARLLRTRLGAEVQLRELQAGTTSPDAWALVQRGGDVRQRGERALSGGDAAAALIAAHQADSLLDAAERADPRWSDAPVLHGYVALLAARAEGARPQRAAHLQDGLTHASRALQLNPTDAAALGLRGTLRYQLWRLNLDSDSTRHAALLDSAQADLESAERADPSIASVHAVLSQLHYAPPREDLVAVVLEARAAYEADAYLREGETVLERLFYASYDLAQFQEARRWCDEGGRRFPKTARFLDCQLWMLLAPGTEVDIPQAWGIAARADSLTPPAERAFRSRLRSIIVGGAIGRAGRRDSAEHVFARARTTDQTIDAEQDLPGYEAVARAQMGDNQGAIALLRRYVATHPGHTFQRGGVLHWWWRGLERDPQFAALLRGSH
ncbi:MAG TPA: serine/threonine-protein kinase [Gemmatimonadales bacterium]|nr:serine/threonine-protein kinase [Gemmatimonadales bacterium]